MRIFLLHCLGLFTLLFTLCIISGKVIAYDKFPGSGKNADKERLLILTDMNSLKPHFLEADDAQSMIRLMLYANEFQLEGFVVSSKMKKDLKQQPELVHQIIDAYEKVQPNLLLHDPSFPSAAALHKLVKSGQANPIPTGQDAVISFGKGKDTEGSEWIIEVVDRADARPLWISIWGGAADLAQALWKVQQTRSDSDLQAFVAKLRVRAITDQDSTGKWIIKNFPGIWYLEDKYSYPGMYKGGDKELVDSLWVAHHVQQPGNALGMLYPNYYYGPRSVVRGVKEGDTPSYLGMIPNGLNISDRPELGGWGGIFNRIKNNYYADTDSFAIAESRNRYQANIYQWRSAVEADFKARLNWCTKSYSEANHAPIAKVNNDTSQKPLIIEVTAGKSITLNARNSNDPDKDLLTFHWETYPGTIPETVSLMDTNSFQLTVRAAKGTGKILVPILLTVTDNGQPVLRSYRRILIYFKPS